MSTTQIDHRTGLPINCLNKRNEAGGVDSWNYQVQVRFRHKVGNVSVWYDLDLPRKGWIPALRRLDLARITFLPEDSKIVKISHTTTTKIEPCPDREVRLSEPSWVWDPKQGTLDELERQLITWCNS